VTIFVARVGPNLLKEGLSTKIDENPRHSVRTVIRRMVERTDRTIHHVFGATVNMIRNIFVEFTYLHVC